jgi:sn-glycerol 3-phosphate transport system substrate-binding protein
VFLRDCFFALLLAMTFPADIATRGLDPRGSNLVGIRSNAAAPGAGIVGKCRFVPNGGTMKPILLAAALAVATAALCNGAAADPIELQWWHAMTAVNGERVNKIAADFNAAHSEYKIVPVFKGSYAETMTAAVAAFRAGHAPDIVQVFEVGTATMMAAKGAIKPVYELMKDAGENFDPGAYLPAVASYYSTTDGRMLSFPFNSSTPVVYWNKPLFEKAGLDPNKPPQTWPETFEAAKKLRAAGVPCGFTASWVSWTQIENFSA